MLADPTASTSNPAARRRGTVPIAAVCLSLIATLMSVSPARADMRGQLERNQRRRHEMALALRRIRRLAVRLSDRQRQVNRALTADTRANQNVESASLLQLWREMTGLRSRLQELTRARRRLRLLAGRTSRNIDLLQTALSHLFHVCPVDQPRSFVDDFGVWVRRDENGAPTPNKKEWHRHQGVDVFAAAGTPVRAPFTGVAVVATNPVGGFAVKVFGAQGFVYNAHLMAYGHLGSVEDGSIIGYVGNTGDASGTAPHDHFEWHPGNGPVVDPFPYLYEACR